MKHDFRGPLAVVLNPDAGGGLARRGWPQLEAELTRRGLKFTVIQAGSGVAALDQVQALPPGHSVLAVGGEGTVAVLLPAIIGEHGQPPRPLALVPLGTGNDFAGMRGLRPGDFTAALDRLHGPPSAIDALEVHIVQGDLAGSRAWLLNGLGMGFDSQVTANMTRVPRQVGGMLRYAWAALLTIRELRLATVQLSVDGEPVYSGPSALVAIMNGQRYGGGFQISPRSDPADGLLNVVASRHVRRGELAGLMLHVLRGQHLGHRAVQSFTGRRVHVRWDRPQPLHLDGDLSGHVTELTVTVHPGLVTILNA